MFKSDWGRNPLALILKKEALSCNGCKHYNILWGKEICAHKDNRGRQPIRCKNYERGEHETMRKL